MCVMMIGSSVPDQATAGGEGGAAKRAKPAAGPVDVEAAARGGTVRGLFHA